MEDHRQVVERQRNPCNPRIPPEMEPRRGDGHPALLIAPPFGVVLSDHIPPPFQGSVDWVFPLYRGCALTGSTACLWSDALSGLAGIDLRPLVEVAFVLSSKRRLPFR